MNQKVIDFIKNNSDKWLESPRKLFFGGRSERAQEFKVNLERHSHIIQL